MSSSEEPNWLDDAEMDAWLPLMGLLVMVPASLDAQMQRVADLNQFEGETGRRDQLCFDAAACADEPHLCAVMIAQFACNAEGRNDVPAGASTGDENAQRRVRWCRRCQLSRSRGSCSTARPYLQA